MNQEQVEFLLEDNFVESIVADKPTIDTQSAASINNETVLSIPAMLCDEKLKEELLNIPDKMGFKIGEVAELLSIKQYVLRYWETEFDILKPKKASNNQRYYTKKDVENAFLIRKLLHRDRFSIEGARSAMKSLKNFVRVEVKKEKEIENLNQKFDNLSDRVGVFAVEIKRLKSLFV